MDNDAIISWLLESDVSIQYQTYRDLLGTEKPHLRQSIASVGWGAKFLGCRRPNGHWGKGFYQPKWTSSHYTLLDLKNIGFPQEHKAVQASLAMIFATEKGPDGGINPIGAEQKSDVCVNGMVLNYASYFLVDEQPLQSVVDFLLAERMADGGFNCWSNRKGAVHSSLHTTLSVLEGILAYKRNGYRYRLQELEKAEALSREFILMHRLFKSDKTGAVINPNFLKLYYPCRWYYDVLRALDYFQLAQMPYDARMDDALELVRSKKGKDGRWKLAAPHPGQTHFEMEQAGRPSCWNTLRAMRVLRYFAPC